MISRINAQLEACRYAFPEAAIVRGWHLCGAGPARFGWAAVFYTGKRIYLGATLEAAASAAHAHVSAVNS